MVIFFSCCDQWQCTMLEKKSKHMKQSTHNAWYFEVLGTHLSFILQTLIVYFKVSLVAFHCIWLRNITIQLHLEYNIYSETLKPSFYFQITFKSILGNFYEVITKYSNFKINVINVIPVVHLIRYILFWDLFFRSQGSQLGFRCQIIDAYSLEEYFKVFRFVFGDRMHIQ